MDCGYNLPARTVDLAGRLEFKHQDTSDPQLTYISCTSTNQHAVMSPDQLVCIHVTQQTSMVPCSLARQIILIIQGIHDATQHVLGWYSEPDQEPCYPPIRCSQFSWNSQQRQDYVADMKKETWGGDMKWSRRHGKADMKWRRRDEQADMKEGGDMRKQTWSEVGDVGRQTWRTQTANVGGRNYKLIPKRHSRFNQHYSPMPQPISNIYSEARSLPSSTCALVFRSGLHCNCSLCRSMYVSWKGLSDWVSRSWTFLVHTSQGNLKPKKFPWLWIKYGSVDLRM